MWIPKLIFMWHLFLFLVKAMLLSARRTVIITDGLFQFIMTGKNNNESCKQEQALHFLYKLLSDCQFEKQLRALVLAPRQKGKDVPRLDYNCISNVGRAKLARHKAPRSPHLAIWGFPSQQWKKRKNNVNPWSWKANEGKTISGVI